MAYTPKLWQDRIKDSTGKIIQEGTPFSAGNMNHIEQGIADAHAQLEQAARQTQTLSHGLNVLNGGVDAPVSIQIEGRTLVPMQNNVLDPSKYYVLADKKTKLKWSDATTTQGIAKFTGKAERPTLIHVSNFENKVPGSTLENPHKFNHYSQSTLLVPTDSQWVEEDSTGYSRISANDGQVRSETTSINGRQAQQKFSFDIISAIERKLGKIPASDIAGKVAWLKNNIARITCNWWGYGSSPSGYKATINKWNASISSWVGNTSGHVNTTNSISKIVSQETTIPENYIDPNGFTHFLVYAEASDGITASTIYTDYVELEIELVPGAILHAPRVPFYEVTSDEYNNILVSWLEDDVLRRYPPVEGVRHVQNPYIMAEGDNLLPPFTEWWLAAKTKVISPYELELNATADKQDSLIWVNLKGGQSYTMSLQNTNPNARLIVDFYDVNNTYISSLYTTSTCIFTAPNNAVKGNFRVGNFNNATGTFTFSNPMLTLGSQPKPFVPRNPSYLFAETKLGSLNGVSDRLYEQDGKYFVRKVIEKDVVLDGNQSWSFVQDYSGFKRVSVPLTNYLSNDYNSAILSKFDGKLLKRSLSTIDSADQFDLPASSNLVWLTISDADSGFADTYTPTTDEIKAYFNGWKVKTVDANNKPTAWTSLFDGSDAPTQTLDYVKANMAPNFTPYKLSYVLATPQVVEAKVEGVVSVNGLTQVEVGSGVIVREKANPQFRATDSTYYLNAANLSGLTSSQYLKYRVNQILSVYKNGVVDKKWRIYINSNYSNGMSNAQIAQTDFDPTADYYVTYIVYDRNKFTTNVLNLIAQYANSIRTALEDTEKKVEDNAREITIHANILYDILKRLKAGGL